MTKDHLKRVAPSIETELLHLRACQMPRCAPASTLPTEVERLMEMGHRDATIILVVYRHGLRAAELVDLRGDRTVFAAGACTSAVSNGAR
jgi:type 1 fimbriae regulatory protein FimB/type 1 fimbriae regulatory protein FimE